MADDPQVHTEHPQYYLRDGNVTFLVEKQLFRVHKYFFERESTYFRNFLTVDKYDGTDEDPYPLDVKSDDFANFLWVWYDSHYRCEDRPRESWLAILNLTARWGFDSMRELAIHQLERLEMDPVEKITLYKKHRINRKLLIPSYVELCKSPTLPSPAEAERLQMETVLRLATARERAILRAAEQGNRSPTSALLEDEELKTIINDVFEMGRDTGEDQQESESAEDSQRENSNEDWTLVDQPGVNGSNGSSSGSSSSRVKSPKSGSGKVSIDVVFVIRPLLTTPRSDFQEGRGVLF
ncbi:hypothetical protein EDD15DRAFT_2172661 [Pisolithus albus]|nr:hypothetical protein EDD15DRAFT_2172661 [Pisolithus albus]